MRLPWYQVEDEALTRGRMLGRLLRVPETQGIGIALELWRWALEIASDGDFSGTVPDLESVAAAVGWMEDPAQLGRELQRVGLIATAPTLRVRGLDRYRASWSHNRRKNPRKIGERSGGDPGATRQTSETTKTPPGTPRDHQRKTETETETETETKTEKPPPPTTASPETESVENPVVVGQEFWAAVVEVRRDHGLEAEGPAPPKWDDWALRQKRAGFSARDVQIAHALYVRDKDFKSKRWPIAVFMSAAVCSPRLRRHPLEADQ